MAKIKIKDLPRTKPLSAKALRKVRGGGGRPMVWGEDGLNTVIKLRPKKGRGTSGGTLA